MPDWQPVSVPDFCPTCGVYWECGHRDAELIAALMASGMTDEGVGRLKEFAQGTAKADGGDPTFGTSEKARRKPLPDVEYLSRQREEPPFDPHVQPVLRYIDEDEDDA